MSKQLLIWYVPVIHQGYLRYWQQLTQKINSAQLSLAFISPELAAQLQAVQTDPATLSTATVAAFWQTLSDQSITWLKDDFLADKKHVAELFDSVHTVHLVDDQVSRQFWLRCSELLDQKNLPTVSWHSVFLRWDSHSVQQSAPIDCQISNDVSAQGWMNLAKKYAEKSSDWWRKVGSIAVKNDSEIMRAYNQGIPDDHAPYQVGAVRDFVATGTQPELANYIHAEQDLIARAAKQGVSLEGCELYVTHFPCPICAKLIARSGIKRVLFSTGSASLDGLTVLERYGVEILRVE